MLVGALAAGLVSAADHQEAFLLNGLFHLGSKFRWEAWRKEPHAQRAEILDFAVSIHGFHHQVEQGVVPHQMFERADTGFSRLFRSQQAVRLGSAPFHKGRSKSLVVQEHLDKHPLGRGYGDVPGTTLGRSGKNAYRKAQQKQNGNGKFHEFFQ